VKTISDDPIPKASQAGETRSTFESFSTVTMPTLPLLRRSSMSLTVTGARELPEDARATLRCLLV
jgi:hypothetical protein